MSDSDSFIHEVTEEVRQDRMFALWKKWAPYVIGGVVVIVAGAAAWSWLQTQERAEAEARGAALVAADTSSVGDMQTLVERLDPPARVVAELAAAAALATAGETAEAAQRYRAIAGRDELGRHYRDLALLHSLRLEAVDGAPAAVIAELAPLTEDGAPYSLLARELMATLHLKAGETEAAHAILSDILSDPAATPSLRQRAREVLVSSGGTLAEPAG